MRPHTVLPRPAISAERHIRRRSIFLVAVPYLTLRSLSVEMTASVNVNLSENQFSEPGPTFFTDLQRPERWNLR